jgi:transcriptional regulator with XRE-family HTH domain
MQTENLGDYIRQLREQAEMPLRKLAALLDIDQSTLSKLERGERPVSRQMLPIIAKTFKVDEKELGNKIYEQTSCLSTGRREIRKRHFDCSRRTN